MGADHDHDALLQDLKVSILSSSILYPSSPTERRSMFLSNIDQILNLNVVTIHFFVGNPQFSSEIVADKLRSAVERILVPYDFLAGRLIELDGRLQIDCNSAGVEFILAQSMFKLDEIGELEYPNVAFRQLAPAGGMQDFMKMEDRSLISFQVTFFKCGGFSLGISNNHVSFDGISFKKFLQNLATLAKDKEHPLPHPPFTNRHVISARSPPRVTFPHPELLHIPSSPTRNILQLSPSNLKFKLLRLSRAQISSLKILSQPRCTHPSSFNAVVAHLWRCKLLSVTLPAEDLSRTSMILYAVDIRKKITPALPAEYSGNAVLTAYGKAAVGKVIKSDFGKLVEAVRKGAERMDDDYVRSVIDWGELYRGLPKGDMFVSSWWKLGYADVEYPWGKPLYTCPVPDARSDIMVLFPTISGVHDGVNVLVALPDEEMRRFEELFYKLLPSCE